ncbi:MAG: DUF1269 domain-containing protein [Candidatus Promineifilaceae bacterium]
MSENAVEVYRLVIVEFAGQDRAKQVVDLVRNNEKAAGVDVKAWAVVEVDEKGKAHVKQSGHGGWGAGIGAGTGVLLGLIGGPAGLLVWALGGALVGGLAGKYLGHQFDEDQLKAVAAAMEPNTSGLVMVVEDELAQHVAEDLGVEDGEVVIVDLADQMSGEFAEVASINLGEAGAADETDASGEESK